MTLINNIANYSFLSLLGSTVFYWIGAISPVSKAKMPSNLKDIPKVSELAHYGIILSNSLLTLLLILRWKESGHFPLSNLYESLMFLSWSFTGLHLFIENKNFSSSIKMDKERGGSSQWVQKLLGSITTPSALLTNAFAAFTLPKEMQEAAPLVPALQSNWLMMHVTVMILSYAALILGSLLSIAFLIVTGGKEINVLLPLVREQSPLTSSEFARSQIQETVLKDEEQNRLLLSENLAMRSPIKQEGSLSYSQTQIALILDNLSYRILGVGFPLLTIGILSGAVWANEAWGSYWSWDPKETWALLTWLIFAIYLHARLSKGWEGQKPAIIASFGFVIVWVCYLGVNLIGEGLHSYGWIKQS